MASEVARAAGIHVSQLFRWRQQLCAAERTAPTFSPVAVVPGPGAAPALPRTTDSIEIEFGSGMRMRVTGAIDASTVACARLAVPHQRTSVITGILMHVTGDFSEGHIRSAFGFDWA